MKITFRKVLCCLLSFILAFGSGIAVFAAEDTEVTPVIVVNDIFANPIYNTEDGSVVSVRPSGTEPKIKFYFGVKGNDANEKVELLKQEFNK